MIKWIEQLFCKHRWKYWKHIRWWEGRPDQIIEVDIFCLCMRCGKIRKKKVPGHVNNTIIDRWCEANGVER